MNYQESNLTGTSWVRCNKVVLNNPLAGSPPDPMLGAAVPFITFEEEKVMVIDGSTVKMPISSCQKVFDPIAGTIPLLDPITGISLGTSVTHAELYTILFSLYLQTALERDAA